MKPFERDAQGLPHFPVAQLSIQGKAGYKQGWATSPGSPQHTRLIPTFRGMCSSSHAHSCATVSKSSCCCYLGQQLIFKTPGPILTHLSRAVKMSLVCCRIDSATCSLALTQNVIYLDTTPDEHLQALKSSSHLPSAYKSQDTELTAGFKLLITWWLSPIHFPAHPSHLWPHGKQTKHQGHSDPHPTFMATAPVA